MLASVKFTYVAGVAGREISREEGANSLIPSSTIVRLLRFVCLLVLTVP